MAVVAALAAVIFIAPRARASELNYVRDTISDSRPGVASNHEILFQVPDAVPPSGSIIINFQNQLFPITLGFGYRDVDLAISTSSPDTGFVERSLATSTDAADDSVSLQPITGPVTIDISTGSGIPAGAYVRILMGTNAPNGTHQIVNPTSTASYHIYLNTYSATGTALDYGAAMVAILPATGVNIDTNRKTPPVLSNGLPTGTIPSNVAGVDVSFDTDTYANCRYATTSGVSYDSMTNFISHDQEGFTQDFVVTGITQGDTYTYYIRCVDFAGNEDQSDYVISFFAGEPTGVPPGGGTYPASAGGGGGGGGAFYPPAPSTPSLTISGIALPSSEVFVLEDGALLPQRANADGSGNFSINIPSIDQGVYSFTLYVDDAGGNRVSSYTFTITIVAGTANSVKGFVMSPSVALSTSTVAVGEPVTITGMSAPSSTIEIWIASQTAAQSTVKVTTSADSRGNWSYVLDTTGYAVDTYQVTARASVPGLQESDFSGIAFLGVGESPVPLTKSADLNGDGKVNLIDFSILLSHWGQNYPRADLNSNGVVDLGDFSIMLFHWTG